eukprot:scaffold8219_cov58-Phaeocystis_antarctica.AAC.4
MQLEAMGVKELRARYSEVPTRQPALPPTPDQALLVERGLSAEGCLEKTDFVNHVLLAQPGAE